MATSQEDLSAEEPTVEKEFATMIIGGLSLLGHEGQPHLRCDACFKYLSVAPVVVTANRTTLCGRCLPAEDDPIRRAHSKANVLLEALVFPCVHHYEDCEAGLTFHETARHQARCQGKQYDCLFCSYKASSGSQLVGHCATRHPKCLVVPGSGFNLPPSCELQLLHGDGRHLVVLQLAVNEGRALLSLRSVSQPDEAQQLRAKFYNHNCSVSFPLSWNERDRSQSNCVEVDLKRLFPESGDAFCNVEESCSERLNWELRNLYIFSLRLQKAQTFRLTGSCYKCKEAVSSEMFFDSEHRQLCPKCVFYATAEYFKLSSTSFSSDIEDNKNRVSGSGVRLYKCIVKDCPRLMPLGEFREHWHENTELRVGLSIDNLPENAFYWNAGDDIFLVKYGNLGAIGAAIDIWKIDVLPTFKEKIFLDNMRLENCGRKSRVLFKEHPNGYYFAFVPRMHLKRQFVLRMTD